MLRIAGVAALVLLGAAGDARGAYLTGETSRTGYVNLIYVGAAGTQVDFFERAAGGRVALGSAPTRADGYSVLRPATTWRCDKLLRRFEADAVAPGGTRSREAFDIRTPSCRGRLSLRAPARARPGRRLAVEVRDTWGLGDVRPWVCAAGPAGRMRCVRLRLGARASGRAHFALARRGFWRITARIGAHRTARRVAVGLDAGTRRPVQLPRILATGDSTIEGIESYLGDDLARRARVVREFHVGWGIARDWKPLWTTRARRQARRYRQRVTVISIGAVDGLPLRGHPCCGPAWRAEYVRRIRAMTRAYRRAGRARVLWLTLPAARDPGFAEVADAVNAAILEATAGRPWVRVLRLDRIFTPGGAFRATMPFRGRTIRVRNADGVHLSAIGTRIAARAAAEALRSWRGTLTAGR